jgi:hypothetical protein
VRVDIFVRSYYKDFRWLGYCLRSVAKYCRGFGDVIVVVPRSSEERFRWAGLHRGVTAFVCDDCHDDYLGQQVTKLLADQYCQGDFLCHVDSDCVFRRDTTPSDLFAGGKPTAVITPYHLFPEQAVWRRLTERFLGREVTHDFMRRQPLVFPRWLYGELRRFARLAHGMSLEEHVLAQPPRGFSEYNALGAFAFHNHPGAFAWIEQPTWEPDERFCRWFWSWGGLTSAAQAEIEALLG